MPNPSFPDTLAILHEKVSRRGINYSLDRLSQTLSILDNPHLNLPTTIHIAGTNGKGSIAHYITQAMRKTNRSVITFTSPHIYSYTERIAINGTMISDDLFCECFHHVNQADTDDKLSEYELLTLMAFYLASQKQPDVFVLETGLGGRLDATNVIPTSTSIISDIDYDHMNILGTTLHEIASEKAGIIKPNTSLITHSDHPNDVQTVLMDTASQQQTTVYLTQPHESFINRNKALATTALNTMFPTSSFDSIVASCPLPFGRLSQITIHDQPCWMDVGHNISAVKAVFDTLSNPRPSHWILGMQTKKDPIAVIEWLLSNHQQVSFCEFDPTIGMSFSALPQSLQDRITPWTLHDPVQPNTIFFGSFFFIEVLARYAIK